MGTNAPRKPGLSIESADGLERYARLAATITMVATGLFFLVWPPTSSHLLWGANVAPYAWGTFMIVGGILASWGAVSRVLQVEHTGQFILTLVMGFYTLNQTMVMFSAPVTLTRAGSTSILLSFTFFALSRYFQLGGKLARVHEDRALEGR